MPEKSKQVPSDLDAVVEKKAEILANIFTPKGECIVARSPFFKDVIERLLRGESSRDIETWLIAEKGTEYRISHHAIWTYRKRYIPDTAIFESNYIKEKYKGKINQLNEVVELESMILTQSNRISLIHEQEDKDGKLHPTLFRELSVLKDLLKASAELKMEMGLLMRAPSKLRIGLETASRLPKGVSAEGITKVLAIAEALKKKKGEGKSEEAPEILH